MAQDEIITQANEDLANKLREEKKKFEDLLAGRQEIEERKKRKTLKMEDDKQAIEVQDAKL